jgi:molybdate transport system substrate-binding protein
MVSVICSMATRHMLADLTRAWSASSGCDVSLVSVGGVDAVSRLRAGEAFDIAVLSGDAMRKLAADGVVLAESLADFAVSPTAVAVKRGAVRPDISTAAALRRTLAAGRSVGTSSGPSGSAVRALLQAWNIGEPACRVAVTPPGVPVARLIASGEVEIGFQQLSELLGEEGIDIVGPVPSEVIEATSFALAICQTVGSRDEADQLLRFLTSSEAAPSKKQYGMTPA